MANISISLEGIDQAISNLNYRPNTVKQKAILAIRSFYTSTESIGSLEQIDMDTLIGSIWDVGSDPAKTKAKRRNFHSIKSSINSDLEKLSKKGLNTENITIGDSNIFDMTEEAKNNLLSSFTDAVKTGDINLDQATNLLKAITDFLDDFQQEEDRTGSDNIVDQIKKILTKITEEGRGSDDTGPGEKSAGDAGSGDTSGKGLPPDTDGGDGASSALELEEDEEIEEIDDILDDEELEEIADIEDDLELIDDIEDEADEDIELADDIDEDLENLEVEDALDEELDFLEEDDPDDEELELVDEGVGDEEPEDGEDPDPIELEEDETLEEVDDILDDEELEEIDDIEDDLELIDDTEDEVDEDIELDDDLEEELENLEVEDALDEELDILEEDDFDDEDLELVDEDVEEEELEDAEDPDPIELEEDETLEEIDDIFDDEELEEIDDTEDEADEEIELDDDIEEGLENLEVEDALDEELDILEEDDPDDEDSDDEDLELVDEGVGEEEPEDGEDTDPIELEEDEALEEIDDILDDEELDDEDLELVDEGVGDEELEDGEDPDPIELEEDEALEEIDDILDDEELEEAEGLTQEELKALEEFRKKKELAEHFDESLGEREKKYNKYTTVPKGLYTIGTQKNLKSSLDLQQFEMPEVYIGVYPVTNALFEIFVEQTGYVTTAEKNGFGRVFFSRFKKEKTESTWNKNAGSMDVEGACWYQPSGPGSSLHGKRSHPVVQVSVDDAHAYASWIGRRIPTEAEWESAARTDLGKKYPWGNTFDPDALNIETSGISDTSPVDQHDSFANDFGIIDMLGNILEWTSDQQFPPVKSAGRLKFCVAKGGGWNAGDEATISSRALFKPGFTSNTVGFRCISEIFL